MWVAGRNIEAPADDHCTSTPFLGDRKSTRLNSSHSQISYAVFCLKKKTEHLARRVPGPCRQTLVVLVPELTLRLGPRAEAQPVLAIATHATPPHAHPSLRALHTTH